MTTQPAGDTSVAERPADAPAELRQWVTIVWDDPVNLMSYVTYVFQEYFSYPRERAEELMLQVHHRGKAVVSSGNREEMERDVLAMQSYNLWATMEKA
ncbi:MAG: ATP-dependent Clp protease adapter ClpS [Tessaracoccus sp.]|uniref:ATP-dependent Clp protease adapter ClpS n=1 Tax=Tessaracoccus sp. TaxID=1971211 RepID=UPI001EBB0855|nr:ATP-dependent Clp protease adapter ClpS [Tessaracoccus sp.]MBK7821609.1 ATP-dependent Clp protease adapter ClpS [Tessaracoccus sp.]